MKLNDILLNEKRAHSERNPRVSAYEQLEKYKDDPSIYISFTEVAKMGIKPSSAFNTPLGVYTYPLKAIWNEFDHDRGKIVVPFAGDRKHIYVVKATKPPQPVADYNFSQLKRDIKLAAEMVEEDLIKMYPTIDPDTIKQRIHTGPISKGESTATVHHPFGIMWNTTRLLAKMYNGRDMVRWNYLLRKLGYDAFSDDGKGFIHRGEPIQGVFLHATAFKTVDKIQNEKSERLDHRQINQIINYASRLVLNDKPIPRQVMEKILNNPLASIRLSMVYSTRKVVPVPEEIIKVILNDCPMEDAVNLFFYYQSRKRIPYPDIMLKYMNGNKMFLKDLTVMMIDRNLEFPPEVMKEVLQNRALMRSIAAHQIKKGKMPPDEIHQAIMDLPEDDLLRQRYEKAVEKENARYI